jgi:RNA polymerase sigma-70 factor (ECF subfamily)
MTTILPDVARGDEAALALCFERYGGIVWSLATRYFRSRADAEDVVQDIFISLWQSARKYDERKGTEAGFITMIARRRIIDRVRARNRREQIDGRVESLEIVPLDEMDPEERHDAGNAVRALAALPGDRRTVLLLAIHDDLTHREIAETTGFPIGTVKSHVRRGLQTVRSLMHEEQAA